MLLKKRIAKLRVYQLKINRGYLFYFRLVLRQRRKRVSKAKTVKISRVDNRSILRIGEESVEVSDYKLESSADGTTELSIVIKGFTRVFESSTNLEVQMK